jgi:hypothetical protein
VSAHAQKAHGGHLNKVVFFFAVVFFAALGRAQDYSTDQHPNEFGVWGGGSPSSNVWIGKEPDRSSF